MTARIVADVGNTRIKWGICTSDRIEAYISLDGEKPAEWEAALGCWSMLANRSWLLAGVHPKRLEALAAWLRKRDETVRIVDSHELIPIKLAVEEPRRVGHDRLLNAVAAAGRKKPNEAAIAVSAGTAITVDLVSPECIFLGGAIFPGLHLMADSLHGHTALLPYVCPGGAPSECVGRKTETAIASGIYWAAVGGIRALMDQYAVEFSGAACFVGGGDGAILLPGLARPAVLWPEMTLEGMRITAEKLL